MFRDITIVVCVGFVLALVSAFDFNLQNADINIQNEINRLPLGSIGDPSHAVDEWIRKCGENTGIDIRNKLKAAGISAEKCVSSNIDIGNLIDEIQTAVANKRGELDEVFKSRCDSIPKIKDCRRDLVETLKLCLPDENQMDLDLLLKAIDSGLDYVCHNGGERIALFMAEDGINCFNSQGDNIVNCLNETSHIREAWMKEVQENVNQTVFTENACRLEKGVSRCVEDNLSKCKDPTTANLIEGLMRAMAKETPCFKNLSTKTQISLAVVLAAIFCCLFSKHLHL